MKILILCLSIVTAFDLTNRLIDVCFDETEGNQNICPLVRSQNKGYCWIYAATNLATIKYRQLTKNELQLSIEQIADLFNEQMMDIECPLDDKICVECKNSAMYRITQHEEGGSAKCALYYMKRFNIIDEYYYPYTNGNPHKYQYKPEKFSNLVVNEIESVNGEFIKELVKNLYEYSSNFNFNSLEYKSIASNLLQYFMPIGVGVYTPDRLTQVCVLRDNMFYSATNHAVVGVGVYNGTDGDLCLKILNSWGVENCKSYFQDIGCNNCEDGYMYLKITNNHNVINNYGWLNALYVANIGDSRENVTEILNIIGQSIIEKINNYYGSYIIVTLVVIMIAILHCMCHICGLFFSLIHKKCCNKKQSGKQYQINDISLQPLNSVKQLTYTTMPIE